MTGRLAALTAALLVTTGVGSARAAEAPVVRFTTSLGAIDVRMLPDSAPRTVENFLGYVNRKAYDGAFFHRSVKDFIVQGGGFTGDADTPTPVPSQAPVVNEFKESNKRGTLAMAKSDGNPNSATNQWFFNESDANAGNLDNQNGGFTVFGRITDAAGLKVLDDISKLPTRNEPAKAPLDTLPLRDWTTGSPVLPRNIVYTTSIAVLPAGAAPAPTTPTAPGPGTTTPTGTPPTPKPAAPKPPAAFRLQSRSIAAPTLSTRATKLRIAVRALPARTRLSATITGGGEPLRTKVTAPAKGGTARLTFRISRATRAALRRRATSVLRVTVTATPPGVRRSSASTLLVVRRR